MGDAIYVNRIKEYIPETYGSFRLTVDSIYNINKARNEIRRVISDIDNMIRHLNSLSNSFGGQYYRQSELERLVIYYRTVSDDLYSKEKELNNSLVALCNYIIKNNKDSSNIARNILDGMKRSEL